MLKATFLDLQAVQKHLNTIMECLRDPDFTIQKRSLTLILALIDQTNIRLVFREIFIFISAIDFQVWIRGLVSDLIPKLCLVAKKSFQNI